MVIAKGSASAVTDASPDASRLPADQAREDRAPGGIGQGGEGQAELICGHFLFRFRI
jgi:hypothetical protein